MGRQVPVINENTLQLYHTYCGIEDIKTLEQHLIDIQKDLSLVKNYRCIQEYKFAFSRIYYRFFYQQIIDYGLELVKQGQEPYFLDIGCCTGTDLRKMYVDGYPKSYLIGVDMEADYIECGYKLFKDKETCPIKFTVADLFRDDLSEYAEKISIVHTGSVFHLFDSENKHIEFIRKIKRLLKKDGLFVGGHVIADRPVKYYRNSDRIQKYYMGADRFQEILENEGFQKIKLKKTRKIEEDDDDQSPLLYWVSFFCSV
ncbi:unnamed protein product [Rhizopus stolonifer]